MAMQPSPLSPSLPSDAIQEHEPLDMHCFAELGSDIDLGLDLGRTGEGQEGVVNVAGDGAASQALGEGVEVAAVPGQASDSVPAAVTDGSECPLQPSQSSRQSLGTTLDQANEKSVTVEVGRFPWFTRHSPTRNLGCVLWRMSSDSSSPGLRLW